MLTKVGDAVAQICDLLVDPWPLALEILLQRQEILNCGVDVIDVVIDLTISRRDGLRLLVHLREE